MNIYCRHIENYCSQISIKLIHKKLVNFMNFIFASLKSFSVLVDPIEIRDNVWFKSYEHFHLKSSTGQNDAR